MTPFLPSSAPPANENAYRFSTKYADEETGLVYYGYRYYSATLGRWVNRDPAGEDGGANLHAFVQNQPVGATDTLGLVLRASDTCVEAYLKQHLADFDRPWSSILGMDDPYDYTEGEGIKGDPIVSEILRGMMASRTVFTLRNTRSGCTASLKEHVEARLQVIRNVTDQRRRDARPRMGGHGAASGRHFIEGQRRTRQA